jgi:uncharacterized protein
MANPSTAHEPSMEEILASIRQIISEDGEGSATARTEARGSPRAAPNLAPDDEPVASEEDSDAPRPQRVQAHGEPMKVQTERSPRMGAHPIAPVAAAPGRPELQASASPRRASFVPEHAQAEEDRHLLSDDSDTAVSGAFSALAHTILAQNARTLEDLVTEMLKPMLKNWLDDNLPNLVERLVKEEIERVSRGRR